MEMVTSDLHFVIFPLMAQGHMVPTVDIAKILAHRGVTVTIITTPLIANRFRPVINRAIEANLKIQLLELPLESKKSGLPEGCESCDTLPSSKSWTNLLSAIDLLEQPAEDLLRRLSPPPACIISDFLFPWTTDVARRINVPRLVFHGPGCFWLLCMHIFFTSNMISEIQSDSVRFTLPGLPDRVEFTKRQITGSSKPITDYQKSFWFRAAEAEKAAYGILVHSFEELESEYVKKLRKHMKVWCIGPVSLCNKDSQDIAERGNKAAINHHDCLQWLDGREPGSLIYVCLGSITRVSTAQAIEIGLGLESTNQPFIWCIRASTMEGSGKISGGSTNVDAIKTEALELKKWFIGFEERVKDRGLIVHGWAPQVLILSHPSVGGFLTHCGWNSILESICAGVPMVTWPHFGDQFLNETFVIEILKIGVRIGAEVPVPLGDEGTMDALVKKEAVKTAVEWLMDDGEDGKRRRKKASEVAEMAERAMKEGGSSYVNVTSLIQDIIGTLSNRH